MTTPPAAGRAPGLSLKRLLLLWLLLPQVLLWLVGGALAYRIALSYAENTIDQSLTQTVLSLSRQVKPMGSGLLVDFPRAAQDILEQDPSDRVRYMVSSPPGQFVLGNRSMPPPPWTDPPPAGETRVYSAELDGQPVRVALLEVNYGEAGAPQRLRVQIAKSMTVQHRIARELVADMLLPLLLTGSLLGVLITAGITRGLRPLKKLEASLGDRTGRTLSALAPIELTEAPLEVHSLAGAVNQLLAAVQRSVRQEKRFLSDAAHQLRTPLAGLIGQTELALRETDPAALRERLQKVHAGALRSAHLVHQMLSLARTEADISFAPFDAAALVREVARESTPRAIAQGIDLGFEGAETLPLLGEKLLLREALINLIDNALHYAGRGATVTLRADASRTEPGLAVIEVEDNGPGLAADELAHVFERFWRASEVPGGCGLGLAIVEGIVQRHGGTVAVAPVVPHGLLVRIQLPAATGPADFGQRLSGDLASM
ncbi:histidine kinase [Rhodoferax koreense]|uniref:histidine kinase n=1 Tax=Rhodoferax koreensis TaxID=1842727 RepID=A0A1P8K1J4_9BURK|nr:sensor histidine kinase [Rhodoferax koreense]APW39883.1 histidine kinase [Rhodoferax koreense]